MDSDRSEPEGIVHLTLDANGNWIIELEDYKALVSDLMVSDQGYQSDAS